MAANAQSLLLILLVCVLCYAWQADAANVTNPDQPNPGLTKCENETIACMNPLTTGLKKDMSPPVACSYYATWETCLLDAEKYCPAKNWTDFVEGYVKNVTGGFELSRDIDKDCCNPMTTAKCQKSKFDAMTAQFTHSDTQCKATVTFWTCTRSVISSLINKCKLGFFKNLASHVNEDLKVKLKECDDNGYDVKVDYGQKGGAGSFQGHPLMTLVATVSAILLGVNRFQL